MSIWRWFIAGSCALILSSILVGCSSSSFVGGQVDNFRAYYNTFYNAEQDFETGLESVRERSRALETDRFVSIFPEPDDQVNREAFERAIERGADVLREHPNSKWVDDALMLIGQSYFYLGNWGAAAEKFEEIIALTEERTAEAQFWLARTTMSRGDMQGAAEQVRWSVEQETLDDPWRSKLWLVQAELYTRRGVWREALTALDHALQGDLPRSEAYRAQLLRGQLFEVREDYAAAARAYQAAAESREFDVGLAGHIGALRTEARMTPNPDLVRQANLLSRDDRNIEQRDELRLLEAYLHVLQERPAQAREKYHVLLHGNEPIGAGLQGRAYYQLAIMHRDVWKEYETAAAYFDSSASALGQQQLDERRPRPATALPDVQDLAQRYGSVAEQSARIARYDSLLTLGQLPDAEFQERIEAIAQAEREARAEEEGDQRDGATQFGRPMTGGADRGAAQETEMAADAASEEAGFLFHRDPQRVQEGQRSFQRRWGDRPREPFWRIADISPTTERAEAPAVTDAGEVEGGTPAGDMRDGEGTEGGMQEAEHTGINIDEVPRTEASQEEMRAARAWAWYEQGNALFLNVGAPDSALVWYERVLDEMPDHPVYERAQYARAEALDAAGEASAARAQYQALIEGDSGSPFAARARARLGLPEDLEAPDRLQRAEEQYKEAEVFREREQWEEAMARLSEIARAYPAHNSITPRTLWAIGQSYLAFHDRDSTAAQEQIKTLLEDLEITQDDGEAEAQREEPSRRGAPTQQRPAPPQQAEAEDETSEDDDAEEVEEAPMQHQALYTLMRYLSTSFPDAPQASRAERLARALDIADDPLEAEASEEAPVEALPDPALQDTGLPTPHIETEDEPEDNR